MISFQIPYNFIKQRVELGWDEIGFGLKHRLIGPKAAIEKATEQLCGTGAAPKEAVELAGLTGSEPVSDLVSSLAKTEVLPSTEYVKAKWLYLVLAWLFENRQSFVDALGIVETVYCEFNYPKEIASFVRYMPIEGPDLGSREQNETRMFNDWEAYLNRASKHFAPTKS